MRCARVRATTASTLPPTLLMVLILNGPACSSTQAKEGMPTVEAARATAVPAPESNAPVTSSENPSQATPEGLACGDTPSHERSDGCLVLAAPQKAENAPASTKNRTPTNVLGTSLETCSTQPLTGWFRDGLCRTDARDRGSHVVCAAVDEAFLKYTKSRGNDLSTPKPKYGFPGLKAGDKWCLCATRWYEAQRAGKAPPVVLGATHHKAEALVPLDILKAHRAQSSGGE